MYDKALVVEILGQIVGAIEIVKKRCTHANCVNNFYDTEEGQEKAQN
jgi:hypothetical protein